MAALPELQDGKTILMPNAILTPWLGALRSGEYQQCRGRLQDGSGLAAGYCCLGVMQKVVDGDVQRDTTGDAMGLPTMQWLEAKGIKFLARFGREGACSPLLPSLGMTADEANDGSLDADEDDHPYTFAQIADAIELCAQGYDPEASNVPDA